MDAVRAFLEAQPLLTLFLAIGTGYLLGAVDIKGLSLGAGAVLFVALGLGAFAPGAAPPPLLGTLGLLLFLYAVGVAYGPEFFAGMRSPAGLRAIAAGVVGIALCAGGALLLLRLGKVSAAEALGLFAGSGTSTPALQAAIAARGNDEPAIGYSLAYPIGVAGPILLMYLYLALRRPVIRRGAGRQADTLEVEVRNPVWIGRTCGELARMLPTGVQVAAIREQGRTVVPRDDLVLGGGDLLLLVGIDAAALEDARRRLGAPAPGGITAHRGELDYVRLFASSPAVVGRSLAELEPALDGCRVVHVRRGDTDLLPSAGLVLEAGDRVGLLCPRERVDAVRALLGDSIRGTAEVSYVSVGVGATLGLAAGLVPIPVPGVGSLALGFAGTLLVALTLGKLRRTGPFTWTLPLPANLVLRNLGLTVFLAQVGLASGPRFAATLQAGGLSLLLLGALLTVVLVVGGMAAARVAGLPPEDMLGVTCGITGNPAIMAWTGRTTGSERPDLVYASVFPTATILKILLVQIAGTLIE